ncbi:MAG TPA: hypothetical protein VF403_04015 [Kofleriaceae bacterium]
MTYLAVKLTILAFVAIAAGVRAVRAAQHRAAVRAKMLAAPATFEDNAVVTLTGTAKLVGEPLTAPLSGKPCIAFRATARTFKNLRTPRRIAMIDQEISEERMTSFVLTTKDGEVIVDGDVCELPIRSAPIIPRKLDREREFMTRVELAGDIHTAGFDEVVIPDGAKIMVHGVARKELATDGGETNFREAPTKIRMTSDGAHLITIDFA